MMPTLNEVRENLLHSQYSMNVSPHITQIVYAAEDLSHAEAKTFCLFFMSQN